MKKKLLAGLLALALALSPALPVRVLADGTKVVTLGANLNDEQRGRIMRYFGISDITEVEVLTVTNQDERDHLASYIPLEQIGTRTLSCAYVCPTTSGGIRVKTANLTYVTSNMIATVLSTSGIVNCDVIAAAPFKISGTGALTGVMMAYEQASGEVLDETKKDLATKELITTGTLSEEIGQVQATEVINDIKIQIIENGIEDEDTIDMLVDEIVDRLNSQRMEEDEGELTDEEADMLLDEADRVMLKDLAKQIAEQGYDYDEMKDTLERVEENLKNLEGGTTIINNDTSIVNNITDNSDNSITVIDITDYDDEELSDEEADMVIEDDDVDANSILNFTDDSALGDDVISDSTNREDNMLVEDGADFMEDELSGDDDLLIDEDMDEEEFVEAVEMDPGMEDEDIEVEPLPAEDDFIEMEPVENDGEFEIPEDQDEEWAEEEWVIDDAEEEDEGLFLEDEPEAVNDEGMNGEEDFIEDEGQMEDEEIPADDGEEELMLEEDAGAESVQAAVDTDESFAGPVKIYVAKNDVKPVEGSMTLKGDGDVLADVDLSAASRWTAIPMTEDELWTQGWSEGTCIMVFTGLDSADVLAMDREVTAEFTVQDWSGSTYAVSADDVAYAGYFGALPVLKKESELMSGGEVTVRLYCEDSDATVMITSNDLMTAETSQEELVLAEKSAFRIFLLEEGEASVTVEFFDAEGGELGALTLKLPVASEH